MRTGPSWMTNLYVTKSRQGWMVSADNATGIIFDELREALSLAEYCRGELGLHQVIVDACGEFRQRRKGGGLPAW